LARLLYALPDSLVGRRQIKPPPMQAAVRASYIGLMRKLLDLPRVTDEAGNPAPRLLRTSPEAAESLEAFEAEVEPRLGEEGDLAMLADWGGKLVGAVVRLAGLLHLAAHATDAAPWEEPISKHTVESAIDLGRYFTAHAKLAFAEMGADPQVEEAKALLRWIKAKGLTGFTKRELFEGIKGRFKRVEALEGPLGLLVEHGYVRERDAEDHPGPGRKPSPTYDVNPLWASHNSPNSQNPVPAPESANPAKSATSPDGHLGGEVSEG
jgi:hypothetical protein